MAASTSAGEYWSLTSSIIKGSGSAYIKTVIRGRYTIVDSYSATTVEAGTSKALGALGSRDSLRSSFASLTAVLTSSRFADRTSPFQSTRSVRRIILREAVPIPA